MGGGSLPVWIGKQGRERGVTLGLDLERLVLKVKNGGEGVQTEETV